MDNAMRPTVTFLSGRTIEKILDEGMEVLCTIGVHADNPNVLSLLGDHGAAVDAGERHVVFTREMIERAIESAPSQVTLYDRAGSEAIEMQGRNIAFAPGSAAIHVLDIEARVIRKPTSGDYVRFTRVTDALAHIDAQSTALIPADVPYEFSDRYRVYLSLLYSTKPIVSGAFTAGGFEPMKDMLVAVRGSEQVLAEKPLLICDVCPSAPLKWHEATSQNLIDSARYRIPAELISMPLAGAIGPATLMGSLVQHTAETLSGLVIHQCANPGAPVIYGGSPAIFDMRCGTTPMGAIETMMIDCAYAEIGRFLGIPTHGYLCLSDAKWPDMQAGFESGMGAALAALAGVNMVSGPGMLDFESCQSIEKLVADNEICGMVKRLAAGIAERESPLGLDIIRDLAAAGQVLDHEHTLRWYREEQYLPDPIVDRAKSHAGRELNPSLFCDRARERADRILSQHSVPDLDKDVRAELDAIALCDAHRLGLDALPEAAWAG
jgi:trimethylamine--corrinoid protein Co-methyltransferase